MNLAVLARDLGLGRVEPRRVGHRSNLVVHLHPAPVVARVMTGTGVLHDDVPLWLGQVVALVSFLAERGAPVAPPTELADPGPHFHEGEWVTLWRWVEEDPGPPPAVDELERSLGELHAALAEYPGELRSFTDVRREVLWLLERLGSDEDVACLDAFDRPFPAQQPLHGDVGASNVLRERGRLLWNDWEDACLGPVEWDLAALRPEACPPFAEVYELYDRAWRAYQARTR